VAAHALTDVTLWIAEFDWQSLTNRIELNDAGTPVNVTTFGSGGYEEYVGGLRRVTASYTAFVDYASSTVDKDAMDNIGTSAPVSVLPDPSATPAVGDDAFLFQGGRFSVNWGATVGDALSMNISMENMKSTPLVAGELCLPKTAITSSSTTAGSQLGAVTAGQTLYAALHVFATTGSPTLDVIIESDDNGSFTSDTDRITFTQATAAGSQWGSVAGAVTDDYWRARYTFGGTGSITAAVTIGIE
jgi:hypothetical protein